MLERAVRDERNVFRLLGPGRYSELGGGWSHAYGDAGGGNGESGECSWCVADSASDGEALYADAGESGESAAGRGIRGGIVVGEVGEGDTVLGKRRYVDERGDVECGAPSSVGVADSVDPVPYHAASRAAFSLYGARHDTCD